ncbi:MAG: hypothetical protein RL318_2488 [Fibrobacterota bacterium]|jgi:DNA-binding transcriptional MerR regulator
MKVTWTQEEVCSLTGLEPHILRFWEGEFPQLRPRRNSAGQRVYRERDVDIVTRLKGWIYDEGLAIPAARRRLKEDFEALPAPTDPEQLGMPFLESAPASAPVAVPAAPEVPTPLPPATTPAEPEAPAPVAVPEPPAAIPVAVEVPSPITAPAMTPVAAPVPPILAKTPEPSLFFDPVPVPSSPSAAAPHPAPSALRSQLLEVLSLLEAP